MARVALLLIIVEGVAFPSIEVGGAGLATVALVAVAVAAIAAAGVVVPTAVGSLVWNFLGVSGESP